MGFAQQDNLFRADPLHVGTNQIYIDQCSPTLKGLAVQLLCCFFAIFGMATMTFLCDGTLLFQGQLPRVLPVTILKYASCIIPYIVSFSNLCGEWTSLVFKTIRRY